MYYESRGSEVPDLAPSATVSSSPHPFLLGLAGRPEGAVGGTAALHFHGLLPRMPDEICLAVPRSASTWERHAVRHCGGYLFRLTEVRAQAFFGVQEASFDGARFRVFDPERAIVDLMSYPGRSGGFLEALRLLEESVDRLDVPKLVYYGWRFGKLSLGKRLGWSLERCGVDAETLYPLLEWPAVNYLRLDPAGSRRGRCDSRWHVIVNQESPRSRAPQKTDLARTQPRTAVPNSPLERVGSV